MDANAESVTVSQARATLPALLDRVVAGEEVTITRHGQPVAVVVRPDVLRTRRAAEALATAAKVRSALDEARVIPLDELPGLTEDRAQSLIDEIRAGRVGS